VIAEGIEDETQAQTLLRMGCHEGQGYLYAKPMVSPQLVQWIKTRVQIT
jgi:EAL domain-containing protein (putative c-di-GMP-specific phosphodiesterase class I)